MEIPKLTSENLKQITVRQKLKPLSSKSLSDEQSNDSTIGSNQRFMDSFPQENFRRLANTEKKIRKRNSLVIGIQEEPEINFGSDDEKKHDHKKDKVILITDNREVYGDQERGRNKLSIGRHLPQSRNYSADIMPKVVEDYKAENNDKQPWENSKHKQVFQSGLDKNEFGISNTIQKTISCVQYTQQQFQVNESIEEDPEQERLKGKPRKISLSIFSSNSNSHVNSPHQRKIFADEVDIFKFKNRKEDEDSSDDERIPVIMENICEEANRDPTPGMTVFGQAMERLNEDLNKIRKCDDLEDEEQNQKQEYISNVNHMNKIQDGAIDEGENEEEDDDNEDNLSN